MEPKRCSRCKATKTVKDFWKDRMRWDGLDNKCCECRREIDRSSRRKAYKRRYWKTHKNEKYRARQRRSSCARSHKFPEQHKAHRLVQAAIKSGALVRPEACGACGKIPEPFTDGRAAIQAHHPDYEKPLQVKWLCTMCHAQVPRALPLTPEPEEETE